MEATLTLRDTLLRNVPQDEGGGTAGAMTPTILLWLSLVLKMVVTACFVVVATIVAERAGPLIGGLIATLPISAGPVYVFLALDHSAQFIAASALTSLAINPAIAVYGLSYALLAQRRGWAASILPAFALWLVLAVAIHAIPWTIVGALVFNAVVLPICLFFARPLREVQIPRTPTRWPDVALRAVSVALLVVAVVTLSIHIGPAATGILALFPIVMTSIMFILHRRVGGKAAAAVMANSILGLIGLAVAFVVLHLTVVPLGTAAGLSLALAASVGWSLLMWFAKRCGIPV
jgi:hypothetical protein